MNRFLVCCKVDNRRGCFGNSIGRESVCNAGDPGLIPGSGRAPGEGIGYPLSIHGLPWWLT